MTREQRLTHGRTNKLMVISNKRVKGSSTRIARDTYPTKFGVVEMIDVSSTVNVSHVHELALLPTLAVRLSPTPNGNISFQ